MNKIACINFTAVKLFCRFAFSRVIVALLNLFLISTLGGISSAQRLKSADQPSEDDLPALQRKIKRGLIKVQNNFVYGNTLPLPTSGALVFDDIYAYVATPNGLFRTPKQITADSSFELIGFENKAINNLYVHNNALYVLKNSIETRGSQATDHSFLKSEDRGATFIPMDNALHYCLGGYCSFLTPTQAIFKDNLIFLNAGGGQNLQVSNNNGASWIPLLGTLEAQTCSAQPFEIINTRVLIGGECPLDFAYLRGGTLRSDFLEWASQEQRPANVAAPNLGNRNVQFIKNKPNSPDVYTGVEGGLLKSTDAGQSFRFGIKYTPSPNNVQKSPYITKILFHSKLTNVIVIGGFDKGPLKQLFLAYSKDNGETWLDISNQTVSLVGRPSNTTETDAVEFVSEDADGRVLVGISRPETGIFTIVRLRVEIAAFR